MGKSKLNKYSDLCKRQIFFFLVILDTNLTSSLIVYGDNELSIDRDLI